MAKKGKLIIPEKFRKLIDTKSPDGIEITEDKLRTALTKLVSCRRRQEAYRRATLEQIYETISIEDVYKNIKSAGNLKSGIVENITKPDKKAEELRDLPIDDELAGYTESERKFIQRRLSEYAQDYKLDKAADLTLAKQTILYEMWMNQFNIRVPKEPKNFDELIKQIQTLNTMILKNQEALNTLKKQVDNPRNKKEESNSDTIADKLKEADKSVEDLEQEAAAKKQEVAEMLKKRQSR